jgi:hypothetical protein
MFRVIVFLSIACPAAAQAPSAGGWAPLFTGARFDPKTGEQVTTRFGELTGARSPRIMQLALRFLF